MFVLLPILVSLVDGCVRTSDTVATTTVSSVTTTTVTSADTTTIISSDTTTTTPTTTSITTTTTPMTTSTTTSTTTTTTTTADCTMCDPTIVTLEPDPDDPVNGHPPTSALGPPDAGTGCATLIVTCDAQPPNTVSLLTFYSVDGDLGNAAVGDPAIGMLLCNANAEWVYTGAVNPFPSVVITATCLG